MLEYDIKFIVVAITSNTVGHSEIQNNQDWVSDMSVCVHEPFPEGVLMFQVVDCKLSL